MKNRLLACIRVTAFGVVSVLLAQNIYAKSMIENVEAQNDEVFIKIRMPVKYSTDIVKKTPKFIIDVKDAVYLLPDKTLISKGEYIKQVRIAKHDTDSKDYVRIVFDLNKPLKKDDFDVKETTEGIKVLIGKKFSATKETEKIDDPQAQQEQETTAEIPQEAPAPEPAALSNPNFVVAPSENKLSSKKIKLNLKGLPLISILDAISRQTGASFVVSANLQDRKFSALMDDVSLRDALRALLEVHGLGYEQIGNSNTFVIKELSRTKMRLATRIFHLKYTQLLNVDPKGITSGGMSASGGKGGGGFLDVIKDALSDQGKMQMYPETNSLIISDIPENFPIVEELIERLDTPVPQVMIEVYFLETNADTAKNLGINYGATDGTMAAFQGNNKIIAFPFTMNGGQVFPVSNSYDFATKGSPSSLNASQYFGDVSLGILSFQQLTAVLKAIETKGDGQYLSKPRVLTLNNKPALMEATADTAVEFETKLFTGSGYLGEQAKNPKRKTTGIKLWVTPQVNEGGMITLAITPEVIRAANSEFFPSESVVDTNTRSITTTIRVKDGSTVLIGGLMTNQDSKTIRKVPLLGHLPLIGLLFSSVSKTSSKRELLIFITPRLVQNY